MRICSGVASATLAIALSLLGCDGSTGVSVTLRSLVPLSTLSATCAIDQPSRERTIAVPLQASDGLVASFAIALPDHDENVTLTLIATPQTGAAWQQQLTQLVHAGERPSLSITLTPGGGDLPDGGDVATTDDPATAPRDLGSPADLATPPSDLASAVLASDTFMRADKASGWGTATDGHGWGGDATSSNFSVASNTGLISSSATPQTSVGVLGPTATNAEVLCRGSMNSIGSQNTFGAVLREQDAANHYSVVITGQQLLAIQSRVASSTTTLASTGMTVSSGVSYTIRAQIVGATISARAWPTANAEPSTWMVTATDASNSFASGAFGIKSYFSSSSTTQVTYFALTGL